MLAHERLRGTAPGPAAPGVFARRLMPVALWSTRWRSGQPARPGLRAGWRCSIVQRIEQADWLSRSGLAGTACAAVRGYRRRGGRDPPDATCRCPVPGMLRRLACRHRRRAHSGPLPHSRAVMFRYGFAGAGGGEVADRAVGADIRFFGKGLVAPSANSRGVRANGCRSRLWGLVRPAGSVQRSMLRQKGSPRLPAAGRPPPTCPGERAACVIPRWRK